MKPFVGAHPGSDIGAAPPGIVPEVVHIPLTVVVFVVGALVVACFLLWLTFDRIVDARVEVIRAESEANVQTANRERALAEAALAAAVLSHQQALVSFKADVNRRLGKNHLGNDW